MASSTVVDVVPGRPLSIATNDDLAALGGEAGAAARAATAVLAADLSREQQSARARAPGAEAAALGTWTGGTVWESATYLATYLAEQTELVWPALRVVEVGCGVGVGGLVAAALGAERVVLTDQVLHVARHNADLNFAGEERERIALQQLAWGDAAGIAAALEAGGEPAGFDVILASDVIYAPEAHAALAQTLAALSKQGTVVLLCTPDGAAEPGGGTAALQSTTRLLGLTDEPDDEAETTGVQPPEPGRRFYELMRGLGFRCEDITPAANEASVLLSFLHGRSVVNSLSSSRGAISLSRMTMTQQPPPPRL